MSAAADALASNAWTPSEWIAIAAIASSVVLGTVVPFVNSRLTHSHWKRDKRADAYQMLIAVHLDRSRWRESAKHDLDAVDTGQQAEASIRFFGEEDTAKAALHAYNEHLEYVVAVATRQSQIDAEQTPLTISPAELKNLSSRAASAEADFLSMARRDCGLD